MSENKIQQLLQANYFQLFSLPENLTIDLAFLDQEYFRLQKLYHPDIVSEQVASETDRQQLFNRLNQAYTILKNPLSRLEYLLQLKHLDYNQMETLTAEFMEFLLSLTEVAEIERQIQQRFTDIEQYLVQDNFVATIQTYHQIKYLYRTKDNLTGKIV